MSFCTLISFNFIKWYFVTWFLRIDFNWLFLFHIFNFIRTSIALWTVFLISSFNIRILTLLSLVILLLRFIFTATFIWFLLISFRLFFNFAFSGTVIIWILFSLSLLWFALINFNYFSFYSFFAFFSIVLIFNLTIEVFSTII